MSRDLPHRNCVSRDHVSLSRGYLYIRKVGVSVYICGVPGEWVCLCTCVGRVSLLKPEWSCYSGPAHVRPIEECV